MEKRQPTHSPNAHGVCSTLELGLREEWIKLLSKLRVLSHLILSILRPSTLTNLDRSTARVLPPAFLRTIRSIATWATSKPWKPSTLWVLDFFHLLKATEITTTVRAQKPRNSRRRHSNRAPLEERFPAQLAVSEQMLSPTLNNSNS